MEAATKFGWKYNTYKSHENGIRGFPRRTAERYARGLRVTAAWLLCLSDQGGPKPNLRDEDSKSVPSETDDDVPLNYEKLALARSAAEKILESEDLPNREVALARAQAAIYEFLIAEGKNGRPLNDDLVLRIAEMIRKHFLRT